MPLDAWERSRYARHILLPEVGAEGQEKLARASVLCVGAGGLGSPALLYLAAAGVGRIGIVDFDRVDETNLQRQVIHGTGSIGRPKARSARDRILDLNPRCRVDLHEVALSSANALDVIAPYDVVLDGTDNFPTRYLVDDACAILGRPWVYGSIFRFEGQASVFNHAGGPRYRDLYPEPPPPGAVPSCAEAGVLGVLPGIIGTIQATEAIKLLLGLGDVLSGRLLLYDALAMRFRELRLERDPDRPPVTGLVDYLEFCGVPRPDAEAPADPPPYTPLAATEAKRRLDAGWRPFILDVRQPREAEIARLPGTDRLVPHHALPGALDALPRDRDLLVVCRLGARSDRAARMLVEAGFERVFNLEGGLDAWAREVDPALPRY